MSNAVGDYLRHVKHSAENDEFNKNIRGALDGEPTFDDSSERFEDWSPKKQRKAYDGLQRADVQRSAVIENAETFLALNPQMPDTRANGDAINRTLKSMYGNVLYTIEMFQEAYNVTLANGNLKLDQAELRKQQQAASEQRAAAERSRIVNLSEADLESLSLEDIRRLDAQERQKQMQAAGERGGNGF